MDIFTNCLTKRNVKEEKKLNKKFRPKICDDDFPLVDQYLLLWILPLT